MKNSQPNIDGFTIRRRTQPTRGQQRASIDNLQVPPKYLVGSHDPTLPEPDRALVKSARDADEAKNKASNLGLTSKDLESIDLPEDDLEEPKKKRRFGLRKPSKKTAKRIAIVLLVIILAVGGYFGWKILSNAGRIFNGNLFSAVFSNKPLKTDQFGRTNILVFGTSEDDPGHDGADLTDSIMIVSVDQKKKDAFLVSVPRDLWVKYGQACNSGYEGKINEMYLCGKGDGEDEAAGATALRSKVGEVFGVDLQYSVHVNYGVVKGVVDAVGGVDIVIESTDPRGIYDPNFDWRCKRKCNLVKWPNGPAHLDGEHALFLAQARGEAGGYGLPKGNFDREANQRKIMIALKDKATSVGFLSNPVAIANLLDSLGNNVRTNIDAEEIKSFAALAKETDTSKIQSLSLIDPAKPLLTTGSSPAGTSIVRPIAGIYDYSGLRTFMRQHLSGDTAFINEAAKVDVLNGSGIAGSAQKRADLLAAEGITINEVGNAPAGSYGTFKLYDLTAGKKPATKTKLEKVLNVTVSTEPLPAGVTSDADFVIIVGANGVN